MRLIFGGSFDPVHVGHLRILRELAEALRLHSAYLMPCKAPVHKASTEASLTARLDMLQRVCRDDDFYKLDSREINRSSLSYTIDSLLSLQQDFPDESLVLVMGTDSALSLPRWHRSSELASLCHLAILRRPGVSTETLAEGLSPLGFKQVLNADLLVAAKSGLALELNVQQLDISSSDVRARVKKGKNIRYLVTDAVFDYICDNKLYRD
jgi:nicotinate-nucleotide adenylyltransferase